MAEAQDFEGATHRFGPPPGLDELIGNLHVFSNGHVVVSSWKPTAEELANFNAGGSIFVSVMSGSDHTGKPHVFATFVGDEPTCKLVVSDTGKVW
jgi:hypothetical protein